MARITAPVRDYSGPGPGGIMFSEGEAETDNEAVIAYCRGAGYGIDEDPPAPAVPSVPDPRDVATTVVGGPLRDAAVDPRPEDFRPPVGAGDGNPHGPDVYAPGLPGGGLQPTAPPLVDDGNGEGEGEDMDAGPGPVRPPQAATVGEWRGYAKQVVDNDPAVHAEIDKATKAELIKTYGKD
ncbi:hypothetical protein ACFQ60_22425 [Streptomyces zhihengii]|uniref:Uncharacterized protein n=1 Tax=Streptomyces zhihengii TaxID=1818004 RepID=A0ABS2UU51_9ACTN|nr:hypothetical protein [Streptomyces zhihengii]MBM9621024.1 hypothetical protein [Streptomyces zhihengii]